MKSKRANYDLLDKLVSELPEKENIAYDKEEQLAAKGKYIKVKYITQLPGKPPSFAFFCNLPQYIKEPYKRFLENKLREKWNLSGVPINIFTRQK